MPKLQPRVNRAWGGFHKLGFGFGVVPSVGGGLPFNDDYRLLGLYSGPMSWNYQLSSLLAGGRLYRRFPHSAVCSRSQTVGKSISLLSPEGPVLVGAYVCEI